MDEAILVALAMAHDERALGEIHLIDLQVHQRLAPQTAGVEGLQDRPLRIPRAVVTSHWFITRSTSSTDTSPRGSALRRRG